MLKYEIKIGNDDLTREIMKWDEKYLSPDLSYITGVTDTSYHLERLKSLQASNSIINSDTALSLECYNVTRQGYIIVKGKEYDTFSAQTVDYSIVKSGETIDYRYVINKDKYFYWGKFEDEDNNSGYTFNNLLNYNEESGIVETIKVESSKDETPIKVDTLYWIEDGTVEIDGNTYIYDKDEGVDGILKYYEDGVALAPSAITRCSEITYHPYSSSTMYHDVTKFKLSRDERQYEDFERITFARYYYYVKYKDHYCQVKQNISGDSYEFVCEIPHYVLSASTVLDNLQTEEFPLYFADEFGEEGARAHYAEIVNEENEGTDHLLNSDNVDKHFVYNLNDLKNVNSFIYIKDNEKAYFDVEYDIMNANDGNEIIVYLNNMYSPLNVGENITFINNKENRHEAKIYNSKDFVSGDTEEEYVIFNSRKYKLEKNLMDKLVIDEEYEYDIKYDAVSGKTEDVDCLVTVGYEKVPMKILSVDDGKYSGGTLQRYGKIVSGDSKSAITAVYDIKPYDGITVNGERYIIYEEKNGEDVYKYAAIDLPKTYTFTVRDKIGSSMYVCEPDVNATEFSDEFNRMITSVICGEIVENQSSYSSFIKNKIFGEKEIDKNLPFIHISEPISSDDYYDLFNDLLIYIRNGYIHIPLSLRMEVGNNILQDDIVTRDFYEAEKKKAINPIVDMEKDVYVPKYIRNNSSYSGSATVFDQIDRINLNFHFRTRNLENWKVNDGYNLSDTSGTCDNWFVTDFHPYKDILNKKGEILQSTSDLVGLMYFTNDDIFYQRSKVRKSFVRLSFYDSTDPQTQSLLATSCVFVDEHALYKKYIDNSRKYELSFGVVTDCKISGKTTLNKISVDSEFISGKTYSEYADIVIDEDHRMSSRLVIDNKYATDTSSEGFYIYIFREYAENLHPKPIYMKVEFNHAGIGKSIPFVIPMHWSGNTEDSGATGYNKMYPEYCLKLKNTDDLKELKAGIPLSYTYAQTYIPLYAVYDFRKREYGYVFDSRYVDANDGVVNLNLFEMKIMDESNGGRDDNIMYNRQERAIINVNTKQFNKESFNYEVE